MFMTNKKDKGITLIALVVTIIVLLILAGVSIAMLTGEGGILQNAREANDKTGRANAIEMAQLDILDEQASNQGKLGEEEFKGILAKHFNFDPNTELPDDLSTLELTTKDGKYKDIKASEIYSGTLSAGNSTTVTADELESQTEGVEGTGEGSIIGADVTGLKMSEELKGKYEWQIFDVDEGHIYLIVKDYILADDCPNGKKETPITKTEGDDYKIQLNEVIADYPNGSNEIKDETMRKLNSKWFESEYTGDRNVEKAMAYLLDRNVWTKKFIGEETENNQVEYVIGGPSVEQVLKSYNKKYGTRHDLDVDIYRI